jgi:hypothetical protein
MHTSCVLLPPRLLDVAGTDAQHAEVDENADEDAEVEDDCDAVEQSLTETAKAPPRAATGQKRKGSSSKVRILQ